MHLEIDHFPTERDDNKKTPSKKRQQETDRRQTTQQITRTKHTITLEMKLKIGL